jgi:hypothetical protein
MHGDIDLKRQEIGGSIPPAGPISLYTFMINHAGVWALKYEVIK